KYLRLLFGGQPGAFGVTTSLKVKYGIIAPAMLVVADQPAFRIGRQRGFSGTRKAKKYSGIAFSARIGRAVHGQYAFFVGKYKIQYRKNAFLYFARIAGSANQDNFFTEINDRKIMLPGPVNCRIGFKARRRYDGPVGYRMRVQHLGPQE